MAFPLSLESIKDLTNMWEDFETRSYITPLEYIQNVSKVLQDSMNEKKLSWIVETFLGINKHLVFYQDVTKEIMNEPTPRESKHFIIMFYTIIHSIRPESSRILYKLLFLLNKNILKKIIDNFSNKEFLTFISELAGNYFEREYISQKIISPLFAWQPYFAQMAHEYDLFLKKIETKGIKQPTVPQTPNVLNRSILKKSQQPPKMPSPSSFSRKFISYKYSSAPKNRIEDRMRIIKAINKQKAEMLLKEAQEHEFNCAKLKKNNDNIYINTTKPEASKQSKPGRCRSPTKISKGYNVKNNTATIKRLQHRINTIEKQELTWLNNIVSCCQDMDKIKRVEDETKESEQKKQEILIEKKHLQGLISFEDAALAKQRLLDENKRKYEEFQKEKEMWNKDLDEWKMKENEKIKRIMEKSSLSELRLLTAKQNSQDKKKDIARTIKEETEFLMEKFLEEKRQDIQKKTALIKEMKIISNLAKTNNLVKPMVFASSSNIGFLCEMSTSELQEKLAAMKKDIRDKTEQKRQKIRSENLAKKEKLLATEMEIKQHFTEQSAFKTNKTQKAMSLELADDDELLQMKKTLEAKRKERMAKAI